MKKTLVLFVATTSILIFAGCQQTEKLREDVTHSYDNLREGITETKETIDRTVQSAKDTADKVTDTASKVKEATDSVSDFMGDNE